MNIARVEVADDSVEERRFERRVRDRFLTDAALKGRSSTEHPECADVPAAFSADVLDARADSAEH
jgi:hypothetical protein